ncbi:Mitochondrial pyruvate carrier 1 [Melia azedarach]|uniref:Mitochondrial pyruvate carrier 1 n=1 Tax=Melia azedarach TaxID=155640 RepID=A0ACC1XFN5_MELAZ|nr:Mitochondrial pyruvate carrier 1 [Melia azedarach]
MAEAKELKIEKEEHELKPWEQHSRIISLPRFDYNAPSSLLHRSHSGFLITCTIKREKSATKEAISILHKYVRPYNTENSGSFHSSDASRDSKRRKICTNETDGRCSSGVEINGTAKDSGELPKNECLSCAKTGTNIENDFDMSLVKLTRNGLLLLTFPSKNSLNIVNIVSNISQSFNTGNLKSPQWCHRIFPIQATCSLNEKELQATVSKLVLQFVDDKQNTLSRPVKFAVAYNRRGFEEKQKNPKDNSKDSGQLALLDRNKCFSIVAAAVKNVVLDSVVDLKSPELSVLIELLPISGLPNETLIVAVSVLPQNLVSTKPRLCIRALVSDTNVKNG